MALGAGCAPCYPSLMASRPSEPTEQRNICGYTSPPTDTSINISGCSSLCLYCAKPDISDSNPAPPEPPSFVLTSLSPLTPTVRDSVPTVHYPFPVTFRSTTHAEPPPNGWPVSAWGHATDWRSGLPGASPELPTCQVACVPVVSEVGVVLLHVTQEDCFLGCDVLQLSCYFLLSILVFPDLINDFSLNLHTLRSLCAVKLYRL